MGLKRLAGFLLATYKTEGPLIERAFLLARIKAA
jgi:hypothetical protein